MKWLKKSGFNSLDEPITRELLGPSFDEQSNGPKLVGVGVPKAGTTWWANLIMEHSMIRGHLGMEGSLQARDKELLYFPQFDWKSDLDNALKNYRGAFAHDAVGFEFSTVYLHDQASLEALSQVNEELKILILLRNPVDRYLSHLNFLIHNQAHENGRAIKKTNRKINFTLKPIARSYSLYSDGIAQALRIFGRDRLLIQFYEELKDKPNQKLSEVHRFIGIPEEKCSADTQEAINRIPYYFEKPSTQERGLLALQWKEDVSRLKELVPELPFDYWTDYTE